MKSPDQIILSPIRLAVVLYILKNGGAAKYVDVARACNIKTGAMSVHARRLEDAGIIRIKKAFENRLPVTSFVLTDEGRRVLAVHKAVMAAVEPEAMRSLPGGARDREIFLLVQPIDRGARKAVRREQGAHALDARRWGVERMIRYSQFHHVNDAVIGAIYGLDPTPYADSRTTPRVKIVRKSVADIIEDIRVRFGDRAAASVRITLH